MFDDLPSGGSLGAIGPASANPKSPRCRSGDRTLEPAGFRMAHLKPSKENAKSMVNDGGLLAKNASSFQGPVFHHEMLADNIHPPNILESKHLNFASSWGGLVSFCTALATPKNGVRA